MQDFDFFDNHQRFFHECLQAFKETCSELYKLNLKKEELTKKIINCLGHTHEGQKTYHIDGTALEVKTPFVYSLDKKSYELQKYNIPEEYNPVTEKVAYSIDKRLCEKYISEAPKEVRDALIQIIDKKPGRPGITIRESY